MGTVRPRSGVNEPEGGKLYFLGQRELFFAKKAENGRWKFRFFCFPITIFPVKGQSLPVNSRSDLVGVTPPILTMKS